MEKGIDALAVHAYLTPSEFDALTRTAEHYGVSVRNVIREAVLAWMRDSTSTAGTMDPEPDEPRREVTALVPNHLYGVLKDRSMARNAHMRQGLREAIQIWLAADIAGSASRPTNEGNGVWEMRQFGGDSPIRYLRALSMYVVEATGARADDYREIGRAAGLSVERTRLIAGWLHVAGMVRLGPGWTVALTQEGERWIRIFAEANDVG